MPTANRSKKFTPSVRGKIVEAIRQGNYIETACRNAGVHPTTFYKWEEKAREGDPLFIKFFEEVELARAFAESKMVDIVINEAERNWKAATWWLERAAKERWGTPRVEEIPPSIPIPKMIIEVVEG